MSTTKRSRESAPRDGKAAARDRRHQRAVAAADPETSTSALLELARRHPWTKLLMTRNPSAPAQVLMEIAAQATPPARHALAYNPAIPSALLARLRADPVRAVAVAAERQTAARTRPRFSIVARWTEEVRLTAASDPTTDPADLDVLSFGGRAVRERIGANSATPTDVLRRLGNDPKKSVRQAIARHASTPPDALAQLAGDEDRFVRLTVAERKNLAVHLLARLAADEHPAVRAQVAGHKRLPPDLFVALARDPEAIVRRQLAAHKKLPATLIPALVGDTDVDVRIMIASNRNTPADVLEALSDDAHYAVQARARKTLTRMARREYPQRGDRASVGAHLTTGP
ncbi:hypothetical protein [uncultured Microbacterium sp.]|uniref:hypothetical protein n=1 Tax=uncultured Microbacterium sp. TaxID=191216 RepID=UPI0035C9A78A